MSGKSNTSKTAHVMNLLSKSHPIPPAAPAADGPAAQTELQTVPKSVVQPAVQPPAQQLPPSQPPARDGSPLPPMIASMGPDAAVSSTIKAALEESLESELLTQETETDPAVPAPAVPVPIPEKTQASPPPVREAPVSPPPLASDTPAQEAPSSSDAEGPAVPPAQSAASPVEVPPPAAPPADEESVPCIPINVMQVMVQERAERYIQMFGVCQCPRCRADVEALALNNLQPKYVVVQHIEQIPRLTVYENQFNSTVTAQILRACQVVLENPRHDR